MEMLFDFLNRLIEIKGLSNSKLVLENFEFCVALKESRLNYDTRNPNVLDPTNSTFLVNLF